MVSSSYHQRTWLVQLFAICFWSTANLVSVAACPDGHVEGDPRPNLHLHCSESFVPAIVDPISSAQAVPEAIRRLTGAKTIVLRSRGSKFFERYPEGDRNVKFLDISRPPTPDDLARIRKLGVTHFIASAGSLDLTQQLCDRLGVSMFGPQKKGVLTDKSQQQLVLSSAGEPFIPGKLVVGIDSALTAYAQLGPAVVVKPKDGHGTLGVSFVRSKSDLGKRIGETGEFLIEPIVEGVEYFADAVSFVDPSTGVPVHRVVNFARYRKVELEAGAPIYSSIRFLPYRGPVQDRIAARLRSALDAFELRNGITHAEFMLEVPDPSLAKAIVENQGNSLSRRSEERNPIYPIEFNFRLPGGEVPQLARRYALGSGSINQIDALVLGLVFPEKLARMQNGWELKRHLDISFLFAPKDGRFDRAAVASLKERYPGTVKEVHFPNLKDGAQVEVTKNLFEALGRIVIVHSNSEEVTRVSRGIFEMSMRGEFLKD